MANQQSADLVEELRQMLRGVGLRSTPARIAVLQKLWQAKSPLTHADISDKLVPIGFDKATVFRNLVDLTEADLIRRTELGDHVWRFEMRGSNSHDDQHPHFVCIDCGSVTCLDDLEFTPSSRKKSSNVGRITEVLVKGYCASCDAADA